MAKLIILFFTIISFSGSVESKTQPVALLKKKLKSYQRGIRKVRGEIKVLDRQIKKKNDNLINVLQRKTALQNQMIEMEHSYQSDFESYSELKQQVLRRLKQIALNQMSSDESAFYTNVVLRKKLKLKLKEIRKNQDHLAELRSEIVTLQTKFQKYESAESDLNMKIVALESKQQDFLETYQSRVGKSSEISKKLKSELRKKNSFFSEPIEQYSKRTSHKKGVYYTITGKQQVVAAKEGKVIYVGSMSNYGNVVMIQHANSKISVYLGQFSPKIGQNHSVQRGEIIGYTLLDSVKNGNLYFEIRHNNIPQKTLPLIEKV